MDSQMKDTLQSLNATLQSFESTLKLAVQTLDKLNETWRREQDRLADEKYGVRRSF